MSDVTQADRSAEYNRVRMNTLLETVTQQRNDAQNLVANLTADKAVIERALKDTIDASNAANNRIVHLNDQVATLERQVLELTNTLAEAHEELRKVSESQAATTAGKKPVPAGADES